MRRRWLDEATYTDIVALCQSLPGPTSSEVGIAIGLLRAGPLGAFLAWLGFTLPSALLMFVFAYTLDRVLGTVGFVGRTLELVALAVVAFAVWRMARSLAWDPRRGAIALAAAALALVWHDQYVQVAIILLAALAGRFVIPAAAIGARVAHPVPIGGRVAVACGALYLALLLLLPLARVTLPSGAISLFDSFYRSGAFVFGGGHVVLPLLQNEVVPNWLGHAGSVPGGLRRRPGHAGSTLHVRCLPGRADSARSSGRRSLRHLAAPRHRRRGDRARSDLLPAFLVVFAALPSWGALRARTWAQSALSGVNAGVVGLLLAALIGLASTAIASLR